MGKTAPNPMREPQSFKLGLFSMNTDGGIAFTKVENRWRTDWDAIARTARMADAAGLDFLLPVARWKGFGGEGNVRGSSFESLAPAKDLPPHAGAPNVVTSSERPMNARARNRHLTKSMRRGRCR